MSVDPSIRGVLWGLLGLVRATAGVLGEAEQLSETGTRVESFVDAFSSPEDDWTSGFLWLCCSITVGFRPGPQCKMSPPCRLGAGGQSSLITSPH